MESSREKIDSCHKRTIFDEATCREGATWREFARSLGCEAKVRRYPVDGLLVFVILVVFIWGTYPSMGQEIESQAPVSLKLQVAGKVFEMPALVIGEEKRILLAGKSEKFKEIGTLLGGTLVWSQEDKVFLASREGQTARIAPGDPKIEWRERELEIIPPVQMVNDEPYFPLEVIAFLLDGRLIFSEQDGTYYLDPKVNSIEVEEVKKDYFFLTVKATADFEVQNMVLREPGRFVIDIPNTFLDLAEREINHEKIGRIWFNQFKLKPNVTRLVIPLDTGLEVEMRSRPSGSELVVGIGLPRNYAPAQNFSVQKVTRVEAQEIKGGAMVTIDVTGPVQYEWRRLRSPDNRFFINLPQTILVGPKQEFPLGDLALGKVRVSQFQILPIPTVRVTLDLERPWRCRLLSPLDGQNRMRLQVIRDQIDPEDTLWRGNGATSFPVKGKIVCLDAGHGGSDTGAINHSLGIREKDITLDITQKLKRILLSRGWNVVLTRDSDTDVSYIGSSDKEELWARVKVANEFKADLLVSVHCNASAKPDVEGTSTHWYKRVDLPLARAIHESLLKHLNRKDRKVRKNRFYLLAHSMMPSALVETAFISNKEDARLLSSNWFRHKVARTIADGLGAYLVEVSGGKAGK